MINIRERMVMLKNFLFPSKAVAFAHNYFITSEPQELRDCENSFQGLLKLPEGQVIIFDLWGRNLKLDIKSKNAYPLRLENPFNDKFGETPRIKELQEDNFIYSIITKLDDKIFLKVRRKIKDLNIGDALKIAREISKYRKVYSNVYGQAPMLPLSNAIRAAIIEKYLPKGSKVLHIGDNDALSIILSKLGYEPFVIDIDDYVCWFLKKLAEKFDVKVRVGRIDVRLPFKIDTMFDAFITDPEHTVACLLVFVLRGLQFTKKGGFGFISWESNIFQRRYLSAIIKRYNLKKIELRKKILYYLSPLKTFYEHMKSFRKKDIGFSIPKWKADFWVVKKEKDINYLNKEFTISLY